MSLQADGKVHCDVCNWSWGPIHAHPCPGCGTVYDAAGREMDIGPYRRMENKLISMAQGHFRQIHDANKRLERLFRHLAKELKIKQKKGRPRL